MLKRREYIYSWSHIIQISRSIIFNTLDMFYCAGKQCREYYLQPVLSEATDPPFTHFISCFSTETWTKKNATLSWGSSALALAEYWLPLTYWWVEGHLDKTGRKRRESKVIPSSKGPTSAPLQESSNLE